MDKYRKILRLYHEGASQRSIARICGCSRNTVSKTIVRFEESSLPWPLPEDMGDVELNRTLLDRKEKVDSRKRPDYESGFLDFGSCKCLSILRWCSTINNSRQS